MYMIDYSKLFDNLFKEPTWEQTTKTTTYVPNKFAVDIKEESATMALTVLGHDPKDIEINCYEDKIEVKAKKLQDDNSPYSELISDIDEKINVGKNYDGRKAKAEIKHGILTITLEKKEESKPKKLTLKVG